MFSLSSLFSRRGKEREDAQDVEFSVSKKNYADLEEWAKEEWAKEEGISVEDVLSKSIAMYQVVRHYRTQGLQIASVNDEREVQATLEIPGITTLESDPFAAKPSETR
jgi:hypothetical protein